MIYYPSLVVNLRLRFDEALHVITSELPAPANVKDTALAQPDLAANGLGIDLSDKLGIDLSDKLGIDLSDKLGIDLSDKLGIDLRTPKAAVRPLILRGAADNLTRVVARQPKTASVEMSGYRQAGKFTITLDYRDLPIDPRVLRSMGVEIHLGTVAAADFAVGVTTTPQAGMSRRSILNTRDASGSMRGDTLLMIGVADTVTVDHDGNKGLITIEGRDLRGILLDAPITAAGLSRINATLPIAPSAPGVKSVISEILKFHNATAGIIVQANPGEWPGGRIPTVRAAAFASSESTDVVPPPDQQATMNPAGNPDRLTLWDVINYYCQLVGAVPYFQGAKLLVRPIRGLYDQVNKAGLDPRFPTPFADGKPREIATSDGSEPLRNRRMVYGRDIAKLKFERKMGGKIVPPVIVQSYSTSSAERGAARMIEAQWPTNAPAHKKARTERVAPSGHSTSNSPVTICVPNIRSKQQLQEIAHSIWEEIGRGEMGGNFSSKDLASFGGDDKDADLIRLRPGDPIEITMDGRGIGSRPPGPNELLSHGSQDRAFEAEVKAIQQVLADDPSSSGDENLARVLVACARGAVKELQSFFRVCNVKYSWDASSGIGVDADFQNFVEARYKTAVDSSANVAAPISEVIPDAE